MASRNVTFKVSMDLAKASKEAHAVTIQKIAEDVGKHALDLMRQRGYVVQRAEVTNLMHYVRHSINTVLVGGKTVRRLKRVV